MSKENIMKTYTRGDLILEHGKGAMVYDINGKAYLDFVMGVAVNSLGHSYPPLADAIKNQCEKLIHVSNLYWNEKQIQLAGKLCEYSHHDQVFFCNSGAESVETALKLARKYGKLSGENKNKILYMDNSFHGRTMGALSVTNEKYQKNFTPLIGDVACVKFNDINDLENKFDENVCGVIIEPIQGEGGIEPADKDFLIELRKLCDTHGAALIFDEVQCGIGRLGKLFAYEKFDVIPDIICMAKGLGGGVPIGATLAVKKVADAFKPGDHGSTFGGNPVVCAAALVVLDQLVNNNILENVNLMGQYLIQGLSKLNEKYNFFEEIKGMGLLLGIDLKIDKALFGDKCFEKGLLLVGAQGNVMRILPPLNVTKEDIDLFLRTVEDVLVDIQKIL